VGRGSSTRCSAVARSVARRRAHDIASELHSGVLSLFGSAHPRRFQNAFSRGRQCRLCLAPLLGSWTSTRSQCPKRIRTTGQRALGDAFHGVCSSRGSNPIDTGTTLASRLSASQLWIYLRIKIRDITNARLQSGKIRLIGVMTFLIPPSNPGELTQIGMMETCELHIRRSAGPLSLDTVSGALYSDCLPQRHIPLNCSQLVQR